MLAAARITDIPTDKLTYLLFQSSSATTHVLLIEQTTVVESDAANDALYHSTCYPGSK